MSEEIITAKELTERWGMEPFEADIIVWLSKNRSDCERLIRDRHLLKKAIEYETLKILQREHAANPPINYPGQYEYVADADELITWEEAINDFGLGGHKLFQAVYEAKIFAYKPACEYRSFLLYMMCSDIAERRKLLHKFRKEGLSAVFPTVDPDSITLENIKECLFKRADIEALVIGDETVTGYPDMRDYIKKFGIILPKNFFDVRMRKSREEGPIKSMYGVRELFKGAKRKGEADNAPITIEKSKLYRWVEEYKHAFPEKYFNREKVTTSETS